MLRIIYASGGPGGIRTLDQQVSLFRLMSFDIFGYCRSNLAERPGMFVTQSLRARALRTNNPHRFKMFFALMFPTGFGAPGGIFRALKALLNPRR